MRLIRNLRLSRRALLAHRLRAALAIAGTAIGIGGVVLLTAVGEGAKHAVIAEFERLGRNQLIVTAAQVESRAGRTPGGARVTTLRLDDAHAIARAPGVLRVAPAQDGGMTAKYGPIGTRATVVGTTPAWVHIRRYAMAHGRFFDHRDNNERRRVAVIGAAVRSNLFPDSVDPIGRLVRIGRVPFTVIGVLEPKGVSVDGGATEDDWIIVPLETAQRRLFNRDYLKMIFIEGRSSDLMREAEREAAAILRVRHDLAPGAREDFAIRNSQVLLEAELATQASFRRLIAGLALLSLAVATAGILSIMLLSVRERRNEIGLRVAVGARRPDIGAQFLAEAMLLTATGGLFGVVIGIASARLLAAATEWNARVDATTLLTAVVAATVVGIASGLLPAWRAASLDPITALHAE